MMIWYAIAVINRIHNILCTHKLCASERSAKIGEHKSNNKQQKEKQTKTKRRNNPYKKYYVEDVQYIFDEIDATTARISRFYFVLIGVLHLKRLPLLLLLMMQSLAMTVVSDVVVIICVHATG